MTTDVTTGTLKPPARKAWVRPRRELGQHVARTVSALQEQALREPPRPEAVSALARLRRGIGRTPGFDYTLESYLWVPDQLLGWRPADDAQSSDAEYAVHDAVTLYALHQQSRRAGMHKDGHGLGRAVSRLLLQTTSGEDGVRRRFAALGTAGSYAEGIYHLRSLVTMLRAHEIPLDYGLLADDLHTLRHPARRADVQALWGREFYRDRSGRPDATDESATDTEESAA